MPGEAEWRLITGIAALWAAGSIGYVLSLQLRIWPDDRQKWSAVGAVIGTELLVVHLVVSYLFSWSMGTTWRGGIVFILLGIAWANFAWESRRYHREEIKRMLLTESARDHRAT